MSEPANARRQSRASGNSDRLKEHDISKGGWLVARLRLARRPTFLCRWDSLTVVHTSEVAGQHHEDEAAVHLNSVPNWKLVHSSSSCRCSARRIKMQLWSHPEDTEGPHIPEAGAKYATLRCLDVEKPETSTKQRHGTHHVSRKELQKDYVGPLPEATEGPQTPEAGAQYATLKCPGGRNREEASSEDTGQVIDLLEICPVKHGAAVTWTALTGRVVRCGESQWHFPHKPPNGGEPTMRKGSYSEELVKHQALT